jgi:hypothetical protein
MAEGKPTAAGGSAPRDRLFAVVFPALLLLSVVPVWWFRFFPSQDGPAHLENAVALAEYGRPDRPLYQSLYTVNPYPDPNWSSHLVLAGLIRAGLPPLTAEKILLTVCLLGLPLAVWYAVRAVRPDAGYVAALAVPFAASLFLHMGFYNFCGSLALFFILIGYWLQNRERFGVVRAVVLAALALLTYFCHLVAVAAAGVVIAVLSLAWTGRDLLAQRRAGRYDLRTLGRAFLSRAVLPFVAFLPAVVLGVWFTGRRGATPPAPQPPEPLYRQALELLQLQGLVCYDKLEGLVSMALAAVFLIVSAALLFRALAARKAPEGGAFLLVVAAFLVVYFAAPDELAGGSILKLRLSLLPYFGLLLWLAAQPPAAWLRTTALSAGAAATVLLLLLHWNSYATLNGLLDEYASAAPAIRSQETVLPVSFSHTGRDADGRNLTVYVGAFRHAGGYLAAEREAASLLNYEAALGYFPLRYRPEVNPFVYLDAAPKAAHGGLEEAPPRVDIAGYEERTGVRVDCVLLWDLRDADRTKKETQDVLKQLEGRFERAYVSPRGLVQVYRRKGGAP